MMHFGSSGFTLVLKFCLSPAVNDGSDFRASLAVVFGRRLGGGAQEFATTLDEGTIGPWFQAFYVAAGAVTNHVSDKGEHTVGRIGVEEE